MTTKKPPKFDTWMPLYISDYLADTMSLTTEQHGAYLLLIMAAWKDGGSLPNDSIQLASISRLPPAHWARHELILSRFFDVTLERWTHRRVSAELARSKEMVEKRSAAGKEGAAKKWGLRVV